MFILDSLFIGGLRFVLDKVVAAADAELQDDSALREELKKYGPVTEMKISDKRFAPLRQAKAKASR